MVFYTKFERNRLRAKQSLANKIDRIQMIVYRLLLTFIIAYLTLIIGLAIVRGWLPIPSFFVK